MTHDELIRFAAGKVRGRIDEHGYIRFPIRGDETYLDFTRYDLTSPDLMLKGMGVCPHRVAIKTSPDANERYVSIIPNEGKFAMKWYDKAEEIPVEFWQCWAELEGGQG